MRTRKTANERFLEKVQKTENCWLWTGSKSADGYGRFWNGLRDIPAHWFWLESEKLEQLKTKGMMACHHCDNPSCVRPSHVFIGTALDNTRDSIAKGRWTGFRDEFTKLPVSRERKRQLRKNKIGLCFFASCECEVFSGGLCRKHFLKGRITNRKRQGCKAWRPGSRGRPPKRLVDTSR